MHNKNRKNKKIKKWKNKKGGINMKFIKGMLVGGVVSAGAIIMYKEMYGNNNTKKQMMKKGKQFAKKMGIL